MALLLIIQAVRLPRQTPPLPLRRLPRNDSGAYGPTN